MRCSCYLWSTILSSLPYCGNFIDPAMGLPQVHQAQRPSNATRTVLWRSREREAQHGETICPGIAVPVSTAEHMKPLYCTDKFFSSVSGERRREGWGKEGRKGGWVCSDWTSVLCCVVSCCSLPLYCNSHVQALCVCLCVYVVRWHCFVDESFLIPNPQPLFSITCLRPSNEFTRGLISGRRAQINGGEIWSRNWTFGVTCWRFVGFPALSNNCVVRLM